MMTLEVFLIALCLVAIIEGIGPFLIPNRWRDYMQKISSESTATIQKTGAFLIATGLIGLLLLV